MYKRQGIDKIAVRGDVGTAAWISCAGKPPWTLPEDQRTDDERSLAYDWDPLAEELEILGHPRARVTITSPHPVAFLSVRLCDVYPDGTSALVSRGVLNLAHRTGHADPTPLDVGTPTVVELELEATSWTFEAGHRVRLALAGSDWPNTWPPPHGGTLDVDRSAVELELPVLEGESPTPPPTFRPAPAQAKTPTSDDEEEPPAVVRRIDRDRVGRQTRVVTRYGSTYDAPFDAKVTERYDGVAGVAANNPGRAWARAASRYRIEWPETTVATEAHLEIRSRSDAYHVVVQVVATEHGAEGIGHIERRFERTIPRRLQ